MAKILRVNMSESVITEEHVKDQYMKLGGRALTAQILSDEVDPTCEPLGRRNKLIFAPGLLGGTHLTSASRLSIGGKSPLTGGIKEANSGGVAGMALSRLGIKAIILEGESKDGLLRYLYKNHDTVELRIAEMAGHGVYSTARLFYDRYNDKSAIITIGSAGERGLYSAGITNTDGQGRPSRFCGRGGLGAVMGSKGLKAMVIDPSGSNKVEYNNRKAFQSLNKEIVKMLKENPATSEVYPKYGTAAMATRTNALHALPTRNFSEGSFECVDRIDGEYLYQTINERGGEGETTHSCMPGCVIKCSNIYADSSGKEIVAPLEYETIGLLGSNCGIGNLDDIAYLNYKCNDLGIDTIETGAAIGVAMDQGLVDFGDFQGASNLLDEIADNTILGRVLGHGALMTGRVLGSKRIPVAKGQAMPAYDPRGVKGLGVTYATSAMGADHTAGNTIRAQVDHTDPEPQVDLSRNAQTISMIADSMGLCLFVMPALGAHLNKIGEIYEHYSGVKCSEDDLRQMAHQALKAEHEFNKKAGLSPAHDRLPEFMIDEPLPENGSVFDVAGKELNRVHE